VCPPLTCSSLRSTSPLRPTPFPYTTLFRSSTDLAVLGKGGVQVPGVAPDLLQAGPQVGVRHHRSRVIQQRHRHLSERALHPIERSEEHTSELQSRENLVCRLLLEKKNGDTQ